MTPLQLALLTFLVAGSIWLIGYEVIYKLIVLLRYAARERDARRSR